MKKIILSSLLLIGCNQSLPLPYHNPELMPMVQTFLNEGIKRGKYYSVDNINIDYGTLNGGIVGTCQRGLDYKKITIDKNFWLYNEQSREMIMIHELGHCVLNLNHNDKYENGIPISIMNTYLFNYSIFQVYRDFYYDELFQ